MFGTRVNNMIEEFLKSKGFSFSPQGGVAQTGYGTKSQLEQFAKQLSKYPHIKTIAEIGLNAGHSAEHFFQQCKKLELFVSFDINAQPYTLHAIEYLSQIYPNRFLFVLGDSVESVPQFSRNAPQLKFDLIYIDGRHHFKWVLADILNMKEMAQENTLLWIDDLDHTAINMAVKTCETLGVIRVEEVFESEDPEGKRTWAEARYLF